MKYYLKNNYKPVLKAKDMYWATRRGRWNRIGCRAVLHTRVVEPFVIDLEHVWLCGLTYFLVKFQFFLIKIKCGLYFLNRFDVLISKIIFKK